MSKPKPNTREKKFDKDEIYAALTIWATAEIQDKFSKGLLRHTLIYQDISLKMSEIGYKRSAEVIKKKICNLKTHYNQEKRALKSGSSPSTWEFWDIMHQVLGSRPLQNSDMVEDSLASVIQNTESCDGDFHFSDNEMSDSEEIVETTLESIEPNDTYQCSEQSPSGWPGSCSSSGSSSIGKERVKITRKQASKRPASDNVYLKQLVDIDKRYLELAQARSREDAIDREERKEMMKSASQFFKSFASLADLEVQKRKTPSTMKSDTQSHHTEPSTSLINFLPEPKPSTSHHISSTFTMSNTSTRIQQQLTKASSSILNPQPKYIRLTQTQPLPTPSQQKPKVTLFPQPIKPAAMPMSVRYVLSKAVLKSPPSPSQ